MRRVIDPAQEIELQVAERLGHVTPRDLVEQLNASERYDRPAQRFVTIEVGPWSREDIGSSGNATYSMRLPTPTAAATFGSTTLELPMARDGWVRGALLWLSTARTGGTATAAVRIEDGAGAVNYTLTDCVINGSVETGPTFARVDDAAMVWTPINAAYPFARGATIRGAVVTAGTFGPTTAEAGLKLYVAFADVD